MNSNIATLEARGCKERGCQIVTTFGTITLDQLKKVAHKFMNNSAEPVLGHQVDSPLKVMPMVGYPESTSPGKLEEAVGWK